MSRTIGVVAVLFVALLAAVVITIELVRIPQMYSVRGDGEVKYIPDSARVHTAVIAQAEVANDASIEVANTMRAVLTALKEAGVSDSDIATTSLKQWAKDDDYSTKGQPKGYFAGQSVVITLSDPKRIPVVTNAISGAGSNDWSVEFFSTKQKELEEAARKAAMQNAIARADQLAAEGNFTRGRVLKVVDVGVEFPSADYLDRDFDNFGRDFIASKGNVERITVTASKRTGPDFLVPEPQEQTATAELDVLFELN